MLTKRIIPCLDVRDGKVVKGVRFQNHRVVGDITLMAASYCEQGADELVFYDITASGEERSVSLAWITRVASEINIPFTVAGGIRDRCTAQSILNAGADKISLNSPALENPNLINELSDAFGSQCVVIGIDSQWVEDDYYVYQYTGDVLKSKNSRRKTIDWIQEVQDRGAGEIVLNCMQSDGVKRGYDIEQLKIVRPFVHVPLIASGGAGALQDFVNVFQQVNLEGALAASVFHDGILRIPQVKQYLNAQNIVVRNSYE